MHSAQVIVTVKQLEPSLREQGIRAIYLFGSVARETQTDSSDIDLAFDLAPGATERFSLIDQLHIQRQLAAALGTNVDLIERDYLRPRVSDRAERET
ncbi:MAG: nucleotidyltransferase domain-containing protein [Brevundimonas diminuta]|jgi:predicted nucleotidyltransferase|uniref:nucleotidyltransferase family protein n=1 Tax=Brevundimonas diminuta TaxID=293 RepID=UPI00289632C9|nr:nucleotidyltransferase domain-containing protein [Brevundimonas diminuta]MBI2249712.1 nucleotidyltransferase domain-containing protein [Brevundimonas diminuta]